MKWDLLVSLIEINFAEDFTTIQVMRFIINGGDNVSFSDDGFI